ncbi:MAG TPA: hypothetical protein VIA61_12455 [Methylomirabilota bacterium]
MTPSPVLCRNPDLPALAWMVEVTSPRIVFEYGTGVEADEDHVVEGAWSGEFPRGEFADALTFTGTGVRVVGSDLVCATPTNTLHPLFVIRTGQRLLVSNSLAFLLARAGEDIDRGYAHYQFDLMSVMYGLRRYRRRLPTRGGTPVQIAHHCNVRIDRDLRLTFMPKPAAAPFVDYAAYAGFLSSEVIAVTNNAQHRDRRVRYRPLTTLSSGYDSPACAVLAGAAGCRRAATFVRARADYGSQEDSGRRIADALGVAVTEHDAPDLRAISPALLAEFLATGMGGDDVVFAALEPWLPGRLLYTGFHGDKVWARVTDTVGPDIVRGDASGASMAEFRLRVGFVNLAIPFMGCVQHPAIHAISNSDELRPWALGTAYDRPIARRLVEEAGVPRELFGQSKKAAALPLVHVHQDDPDLAEMLSPQALAELIDFIGDKPLFSGWRDRAEHVATQWLYRVKPRLGRVPAIGRLANRLAAHDAFERHFKARTPNVHLFAWAMSRMRARYDRQRTSLR